MQVTSTKIVVAGTAAPRLAAGPHKRLRHTRSSFATSSQDTCRRCTAARQAARKTATGLEELLWDGTPLPQGARIAAAARVFSEGNGYLPGQIIDRSA